MKKWSVGLAVLGMLGGVAYFDMQKKYADLTIKMAIQEQKEGAALTALRECEKNLDSQNQQILLLQQLLAENRTSSIAADKLLMESIFPLSSMFPTISVVVTGEKKYNIIASMGTLMSVSCEKIIQKASGSEITLQFVNLYAVTASNIDVTVIYSKENNEFDNAISYEEWVQKNASHEKYKKQKTEMLAKVEPGTAATLKIFIPEYKPDEIKFLSVSLVSKGMLYKQ